MTLKDKLKKYKIVLASKSPRRQHLLKELGIRFKIITKHVKEEYPADLKREGIALYLCEIKANAFDKKELKDNTLVIAADTIVWLNNEVISKPKDFDDAVSILKKLSGNKHEVITGICLRTIDKMISFHVSTDVYFKNLSSDEITYYVKKYKPYDKAGAYGIQEWIGYIGIEKINGSYLNVVGFPVKELYDRLIEF